MFLWVITLACVLSATGSVVPCGQVITDRSSRIKNHRLVKRLTGEQAVAAGHAAAEIWKILGFLTSAADDGNFAASISDMNIMRCTIQELGGDIGFDSDESFRTALVPRIGDDPVWLPFLVREAKIFAGIQYVSYLEQTRQHAVEVHGRDLFKELIEKNDKREKTYRTRVYSRTAKLRTEAREASDIILLIPQDAKTYSVDFKIGSAALAKYRKWLVERIAFYDQNNLAAGDGEDIQEFVLDWVIAVEFRTTVALSEYLLVQCFYFSCTDFTNAHKFHSRASWNKS